MSDAKVLECDTQTYRNHPAISQSDIKLFARNRLLYYRTRVTGDIPPTPPTPQQEFGVAVERMLREGIRETLWRYVVIPRDVLNKDGHRKGLIWTEWRDEIFSKQPDAILVTPEEYEAQTYVMRTIHNHVNRHAKARALLLASLGTWNPRIVWIDDETGLERKAELDFVSGNDTSGEVTIVDVKTTRALSDRQFEREVDDWGYDLQAATYIEAVRQIDSPDALIKYYLVAISNCEPYDVAVFKLADSWLDYAQRRVDYELNEIAACLANPAKWWIRHGGGVYELNQPRYAQARDAENALSHEWLSAMAARGL